tara:strand:+ start:3939 stop:5900 length:1962 start_codon:yes stop_codon:yes gene_type:complete
MIYQEIIFDTIFDIIKFKNLILSLVFIFFIYLLYQTYLNLNNQKIYYKILITTLRFIIILSLLPLFLNKNYTYDKNVINKQNFGVIIDNSESMSSYTESILDIINSIDSNKQISNVNTIYFNLDSIIDFNNIIFNKKYTSYEMFSSYVQKNDLDQIILLSDGNVNYGSFTNFDNFKKLKSFNIISFGKNYNNSLTIKDIKLTNDKNKISSTTKLKINSQKELISEFEIFESNSNNILVKDTLYFNPGNYFTDVNYILSKSSSNKNLTYKIDPINFTNESNQNIKNVTKQKNNIINILMITGAASYNTSFIKNLLNDEIEYELKHVFADDEFDEMINKYNLVIIDNFFNETNHLDILNDINRENIPIIVFDGVNESDDFLLNLFDIVYNDKIFQKSPSNEKKLIFNDKIYGSISTNKDYYINNNNFNMDYYSNNSISVIEKNNFVTVLIHNLGQLDFYQKNVHNKFDLSDHFKFLIKRMSKKNLLDLNVDKYLFFSNEPIILKTDFNEEYDNFEQNIIIKNLLSNTIDTISFDESIYIKNQGKFEINLLFKGTNDILINSNKVNIEVLDDFKEKYHMVKNKEFLTNICSNLNGIYINNEEFNSLYFENLNYDLKESNIKDILSALDIFISEYIYYLIILFFSFEIYFRKKIGLL